MSDLPEPAHDKMWREIKAHLKVQSFAHVSWQAVYRAKQDLGYPLNEWERDALSRKLSPATPIGPPISEAEEEWWQK